MKGAAASFAAVATMTASVWLAAPAAAANDEPAVVVGTSSGLDPDKIVVESQGAEAEYHYALDLPEGASLHAAAGQDGADGITTEVVLRDSTGAFLGAYDQPVAAGSDSALLPSTYRIEGSTLIQTGPWWRKGVANLLTACTVCAKVFGERWHVTAIPL